MREYRKRLIEKGQSSPVWLSDWVIQVIKQIEESPLSIVDIGCGLGCQMKRIREQFNNHFYLVEGIDWSPATYGYHQNNASSPFDKVKLCHSSCLPYKDNSFDVALSMENMEHLYSLNAIKAIQEMTRIAKYVLITTPHPLDVINHSWLRMEIQEATLDGYPLNHRDYTCLESAVHKSTLFPDSMIEAGFTYWSGSPNQRHSYYFGKSSAIDASKIYGLGIEEQAQDDQCVDFRNRYLQLLKNSLGMDAIVRSYF